MSTRWKRSRHFAGQSTPKILAEKYYCVNSCEWKFNFSKTVEMKQNQEVALKCDKCPKKYQHQSSLNQHKKVAHEGLKIECPLLCGKTFFKRNHVDDHMNFTHLKKALPCHICDMKFMHRCDLAWEGISGTSMLMLILVFDAMSVANLTSSSIA